MENATWTTVDVIDSTTADARNYIDKHYARLVAVPAAARILDAVAALSPALMYSPDVTASWYDGADAAINIHLAEGCSPSFVRELVKALGVPMARKSRSYSSEGLNVTFTHDRVRVTIYGYVPDTCHVEYENVVIPAQPERVQRRAKVVCAPADDV